MSEPPAMQDGLSLKRSSAMRWYWMHPGSFTCLSCCSGMSSAPALTSPYSGCCYHQKVILS